MATLDSDVQSFIVKQLAWYRTPSQVASDVQDEFGVEVTRSQVQYYDPETGRKPAQKWQDEYYEMREAIQEKRVDVAIENEVWRLRELLRIYRQLMRMGNVLAAADILKQAAEDRGGKYTNRTELTGKDGGPVETEAKVQVYLPDNGRNEPE